MGSTNHWQPRPQVSNVGLYDFNNYVEIKGVSFIMGGGQQIGEIICQNLSPQFVNPHSNINDLGSFSI